MGGKRKDTAQDATGKFSAGGEPRDIGKKTRKRSQLKINPQSEPAIKGHQRKDKCQGLNRGRLKIGEK